MPLLLTLLALASLALPQQSKARAELFARAEGDTVRAVVQIKIDRKWHLYHEVLGPPDAIGLPTVLTFSGEGFEWSRPRFPEPIRIDQEFGMDDKPTYILGHEGTIAVYAMARKSPEAALEEVELHIKGLTCEDGGQCIPYEANLEVSGRGPDDLFAKFPGDLALGDAAEAVEPESGAGSRGLAFDEDGVDWDAVTFAEYEPRGAASDRGLLAWLAFAFIAGALLNVMPCVLPVLSIKVLSFVQQAGESRGRVLALGVTFAAGILTVFLALAALAAFAGQGWGAQFQNEAFKIAMVAIVFAFSLSLFDVYELGVPSGVGNLAAMRREGLGDAYFKGIMATILATPCSGPFLGSTLTWALAQPALTVFAVFLTVGLGMASPYVLFTANPRLLKFLPKPGAWMQTFKHLMGFVLLATVVFLMVSVRQDYLIFTVVLLVFVALGCWWWGKFATFEQTTLQRLRTLAVALAITGLGAWFSFGPLRGSLGGKSTIAWRDFDPELLAELHGDGTPFMVDFTADW